ncbi:hypothetical protein [Burkholderia stagnalis]|uniref:hypothetical protein n=1 Tax=Burkholderia stagnalis TaxID=1503054 RepID=UPI000F8045C2|nr:hypothetical protein [Burkholderia stagnalis]
MTKPKKQPPSPDLVQKIEKLLLIAMAAPVPSRLLSVSEDKLFEIWTLARLLRAFKSAGGSVTHIPPVGKSIHTIVVAGNPASADKTKFSHFEMNDGFGNAYEAWVSVEMKSLSWSLNPLTPIPLAGMHELDVGVFLPNGGAYPPHTHLCVGVSCKNVKTAVKENVREALGLRRESAFLRSPNPSRAPWLVPTVPADPPSPLFLVSSDPAVKRYRSPVDELGLYVRYLHFKS